MLFGKVLVPMIVLYWIQAVDNKKGFGALFTYLSKAFNFISHNLLIAKLHAYGLSFPALKLIISKTARLGPPKATGRIF